MRSPLARSQPLTLGQEGPAEEQLWAGRAAVHWVCSGHTLLGSGTVPIHVDTGETKASPTSELGDLWPRRCSKTEVRGAATVARACMSGLVERLGGD